MIDKKAECVLRPSAGNAFAITSAADRGLGNQWVSIVGFEILRSVVVGGSRAIDTRP